MGFVTTTYIIPRLHKFFNFVGVLSYICNKKEEVNEMAKRRKGKSMTKVLRLNKKLPIKFIFNLICTLCVILRMLYCVYIRDEQPALP